MENEYLNPSKLLLALIDSLECPLCIIDDSGNIILNTEAKKLKKEGFDIDLYSRKIKKDSMVSVSHLGKKYSIQKKDINHGTNSCLCKILPEDDTINRLTESSKKLQQVLSAL
jgi:hypothetical protein